MEASRLMIRHKALSSAASFSPLIFVEMLVWHTLYPFSIPLVYWVRGKTAVVNLRLLPVGKLYTFAFSIQFVTAVFFWTAVGTWGYTWAVTPASRDASSGIESMMNFEALVLIVAVFFQRCAIATKWATVQRSHLRRLSSATIPVQELNDEQLLTTWLNLTPDTLEREMAMAARDVLGMDAHTAGFTMTPLQRTALIEHLANMASTASGEEAADTIGPLATSTDGGGTTSVDLASGDTRPVVVAGRATSAKGTRVSPSPMPVVQGGDGTAPSGGRRPSATGGGNTDVVGEASAPRMQLDGDDAPVDGSSSGGGGCGDGGAGGSSSDDGGGAGLAGGHVFVSAHWLAKMLFKRANVGAARLRGILGWVSTFAGLAAAFLPMIVRGSYGLPIMGSSSMQHAFFASCLLSQWYFTFVCLNYLNAAILDYRRRCNALKRLCTLCALPCGAVAGVSAMAGVAAPGTAAAGGNTIFIGSPAASSGGADEGVASPTPLLSGGVGGVSMSRLSSPVTVSTSPVGSSQQQAAHQERDGRGFDVASQLKWPVLTVDTSDNALAFLFVRRLVISFGLRFQKRIQLYQGQALLLVFGIAAAMLSVLAVVPRYPSGLPALVSFGLQALLYLVVITMCILGCLYYGASSNSNATEACALMAAKVLELRNRRVRAIEARDPAANGLKEAIHTVQEVSSCVDYDYRLDPIRILGFPASPALLQALFAASASAASLSFKLLTSNTASFS